MLFLFSKKQVALISFIFGLPLIMFSLYFIFKGISDYLLISLMFIIGLFLMLGGQLVYKDSLKPNEKYKGKNKWK